MKIYKVSCLSDCGGYFQAYLQSVTLYANSESEALQTAKKWGASQGEKFIKADKNIDIELLSSYDTIMQDNPSLEALIIDYVIDTDY